MGCVNSTPSERIPGAQGVGGLDGVGGADAGAPVVAPGPRRVKLVLLGDSGVGKSCLVARYVRGTFDTDSKITVGAAFMAHTVHLRDGRSVKFEIWDTAGQERYKSLAPLYYRGAQAAHIVYDVTNERSFENAKNWIKELHKNDVRSDITITLVGNKVDLPESTHEVGTEEAAEYAASHNMLFLETSAKDATGVHELFENLAQTILDNGP